jgi:HD-like signal output (HDOD) protein
MIARRGKPHIVFVDDDANMLAGLRRSLLRQRGEWDMSFCASGPQALDLLAGHAADVVVSDMRMPDMDGASLLSAVAAICPRAARIILSGHTDRNALVRTIGPAHQWLSKPCSPEALMAAVRRSLTVRRVLGSLELQEMIAALQVLPALPRLFADLMAELDSETGSVRSLAELVKSDVALTTQLLKLVNSGYFGMVEAVTDVESAIQMMGFETVRMMVLHSGVFGRFTEIAAISPVLEQVSRRSCKTAELARQLALHERLPLPVVRAAACASLLAHVGTVVLAANFPGRFQRATGMVEESGLGMDRAEQGLFQADHALLGAYLLGLWGFSDAIVEAVAFHHRPGASGSTALDVITITHVAQYLARAESRPGYLDGPFKREIDYTYLLEIGVTDRIESWIGVFRRLCAQW